MIACWITFPLGLRAQVTGYSLSKSGVYLQQNEKEVVLQGFEFRALVTGDKGLSEIPVPTFATGKDEPSKLEWSEKQSWSFERRFENQQQLEEAFQPGEYRVTLREADPLALQVGGLEQGYPKEIPQVVGGKWEEGSLVISAEEDSVVRFTEFTSFAAGRRVFIELTGEGVSISQLFKGEEEKAIPTAFAINSKTLTAGLTYTLSISFDTVIDQNRDGLPGAEGLSTLSNRTILQVFAVPEPSPMALLVLLAALVTGLQLSLPKRR